MTLDARFSQPALRGLRVLIADDNDESRVLLCELLTASGALCSLAGTGVEAFQTFTRRSPDIVVSDIWMPDGDGFDLIRRIRALPPDQGGLVPAIAMSGAANEEQVLMAGYHQFAAKPLDPALLVGMLTEFAHSRSDAPGHANTWTISSPSPGLVIMTFAGYVSAADTGAAVAMALLHLDAGDCDVVVDLSRMTGFSAAGAPVAQRAAWARRGAVRHVHFVGGSPAARIVASASCRLLGIGCTLENQGSGS
jgi:CheY-like chemotaxis protein